MQFVFAFDSCSGTDIGGSKAKAVELMMTEAAEEEARLAAEAKAEAERVAAEAKAAQEAQVAAEAKAAEEERLRLESEKARVAEEKALADRQAAEKAAKEEADRKAGEQVAAWCKKNGFMDMSTQKKSTMSGSKFPLHVAVANTDAEMVGFMVQLGVDKAAKNSKGQTATDLATKLNKNGSMDAILASLK